MSTTEILSASTLAVGQGKFLQREQRVRSYKFQWNCKLQVLYNNISVANYELNLELEFSKNLLSQTLKLQVANVFYDLNFYITC